MTDPSQGPSVEARQPLAAKLIFNPASGSQIESAAQLMEITKRMQGWQILPEVFLVHPAAPLEQVARDAIRRGIKLIVVSGGDGTIDAVAGGLVGTDAVLGIIPTGTQNNTARSLGIPLDDIPGAVGLLRRGRRLKVDMGKARHGEVEHWFLETASVGLLSALYPAADDIQHGEFARIGDLLATLISSKWADITITMKGESQGREQIKTKAHMVMVSNMPYIGAQFQASEDISFKDSKLDVFVFANLNKLDLIGYAVQAASGVPKDPRIQHYRVKRARIETDPEMSVMADGILLGEGQLEVSLHRQGLLVMAGEKANPGLVTRSESKLEA
jgi:diacylglycerol kinase family enzyme